MADYTGLVAGNFIVSPRVGPAYQDFASTGGADSLLLWPATEVASGFYAASDRVYPVPPAVVDYSGFKYSFATIGRDWFDMVHMIPRTKLVFGNIVSQITDTFEVFSAYKYAITFNSFTNNVGAGVSVPDLPTIPSTLDPFTSFVDPSSTRLNYLPMEVVVSRDGVPIFDDTLEFGFNTGDLVFLAMSGSRVSMITAIYEEPLIENWNFLADTISSDDGQEQVISLVSNPIQSLQVKFRLDGTDRQRMQTLLHGSQAKLLALPLWHEDFYSTAALTVSDTSAVVEDTTNIDIRVGGVAAIFESPTKFDLVVLSAVSTNSISFATTPLLYSYGSGARVVPVRFGYITSRGNGNRTQQELEDFDLTFRVTDNDTGMFAASTSGWSSYDGKVLLDDCNVMNTSEMPFVMDQKVYVVDNDVGSIEIITDWASNRRQARKGFAMHNRAEYMKVKKLLLSLRGKQVPFRIPTFNNDLTLSQPLQNTVSSMDIENISFSKFSQQLEPKKHFKITFADGTSLYREITASTELSATEERLTLNTAWTSDRAIDEVVRIEFLELTRFNANNFVFRIERQGLVRLTAATETLINPA